MCIVKYFFLVMWDYTVYYMEIYEVIPILCLFNHLINAVLWLINVIQIMMYIKLIVKQLS